ncbi:MAG: D-tyrosyl-tRNA(Tyr) deacylase [Pyramidobacter sp.]|nr:D-tyrosyl-tRNA(Tyr) deacylase [Pyramidobacter sp.]
MRAVVQRVSSASVDSEGVRTGAIGAGFCVLLGVTHTDTDADAKWLAEKIAGLRVFEDGEGKLNRSLLDVGGEMLVVSQFTLYGDCRRGKRPSFSEAARPELANGLYEKFVEYVKQTGVSVQTGVFQTMMAVSLVNDGPVTLIIDTPEKKS